MGDEKPFPADKSCTASFQGKKNKAEGFFPLGLPPLPLTLRFFGFAFPAIFSKGPIFFQHTHTHTYTFLINILCKNEQQTIAED